ncbi:hypothetical protein BJV74DRAFT_259284 [Russula compacta]|nr:hypothetical protein BJV74DRAFT_259284 [Russula compacta]
MNRYVGAINFIRQHFLEVIPSYVSYAIFQVYNGSEFMEGLVEEMMHVDPAKRRALEEVKLGFSRIRDSLNEIKLRSLNRSLVRSPLVRPSYGSYTQVYNFAKSRDIRCLTICAQVLSYHYLIHADITYGLGCIRAWGPWTRGDCEAWESPGHQIQVRQSRQGRAADGGARLQRDQRKEFTEMIR